MIGLGTALSPCKIDSAGFVASMNGQSLKYGQLPLGVNFSRASVSTQSDMDSVVNALAVNEACFPGLRYGKNLVASSTASLTPTGSSSPAISTVAGVTRPDGSVGSVQQVVYAATGDSRARMTLATSVTSATLVGSIYYQDLTLGQTSWSRYAVALTNQTGAIFDIAPSGAGLIYGHTYLMCFAQCENKTGSLNPTIPSEYISTGVLTSATNYHGTGVDGSQYFTTRNGNVVQQNLLHWSQDFTNAAWSKTNCSAVASNILAPDGTLTAQTVTNTAGNNQFCRAQQGQGTATMGQYAAFSCHFQQQVGAFGFIDFNNNGNDSPAVINLQTGAVVSFTAGYPVTVSAVANGYWRVTISGICTVATGVSFLFGPSAGVNIGSNLGQFVVAWGAQEQPGEVASSYVPTTSAAVNNNIVESYAGTPLDLTNPAIGLRAWGARTNSIRNNTMVGATAGTPGTAPTNWTVSAASGIATSIIGSGTENGIPYVDVQFSGTPAANGVIEVQFDSTTQVASSSGQVWNASFFSKLVGGGFNNITSSELVLVGYNAGTVQTAVTVGIPGASTQLSGQRSQVNYTTITGNSSVMSYFQGSVTTGNAINLTLRLGAPQLEQVVASTDVASDVIFTSGSAVTQAQDISNSTSLTINASQGTLQVEFTPMQQSAIYVAASLSDGTNNNHVNLFSSVGSAQASVTSGGTSQQNSILGAITAGAVHRIAAAYGTANSDAVVDAGAVQAGTGATPPVGMTRLDLGSLDGGTYPLFGVIRNFHVYQKAANDATLMAITAANYS
jgi:hypothetical protein